MTAAAATLLAGASAFAAAAPASAATASAATASTPSSALAAQPIWAIASPGPDLTESTSDRVVDVANWSTDDRGRVHMWHLRSDGNVENQRWTVVDTGDGDNSFYLVNRNSGLCLDKSMDNGNVDGALVYQYGCRAHATNQEWSLDGLGAGGYLRFRSKADGRCLDIRDKQDADDATVQVWGCNSIGWNQAWYVYYM